MQLLGCNSVCNLGLLVLRVHQGRYRWRRWEWMKGCSWKRNRLLLLLPYEINSIHNNFLSSLSSPAPATITKSQRLITLVCYKAKKKVFKQLQENILLVKNQNRSIKSRNHNRQMIMLMVSLKVRSNKKAARGKVN